MASLAALARPPAKPPRIYNNDKLSPTNEYSGYIPKSAATSGQNSTSYITPNQITFHQFLRKKKNQLTHTSLNSAASDSTLLIPCTYKSPCLLRGTIVNRTYGTPKKTAYLPIFTRSMWSYSLWFPVPSTRGRSMTHSLQV